MTNKKSSYQKLKDKNAALYADIKILVSRDTLFLKQLEIKYRYLFDAEDMIMFGSPTMLKK